MTTFQRRPYFKRPAQPHDSTRINENITAPKVRYIDERGEMVGVIATSEAMRLAQAAGLDLIEVSPNAEPPVCKAMGYGKYKYEKQKQLQEARKKQKVIQLKELKMRPTIDPHDLETKLKAAHRFIEDGDKVKFTIRFRGREMEHKDIGFDVMRRIQESLGDRVRVDNPARFEGTQLIMIISPAPK